MAKLTTVQVTAVEPYSGPTDPDGFVSVYDLTANQTNLYFAGGVLVGNSKRVSLLESNALLAHGATQVLRDAILYRGQQNADFWSQFMKGHTPADPPVPQVYTKFVNTLQGSGINVVKKGGQLHLLALTDKDVDQLAEDREHASAETVNFYGNMEPVRGGLFDPKLIGDGRAKWTAIRLAEPLPNPAFEEPIRRLLGLTQKQFDAVMSGEEKLDGRTGPAAIATSLKAIDLDRAISQTRHIVETGKKTQRDAAVRKLGYLRAAKATGVHPGDWVLRRVPVLPAVFRPVSRMQETGASLVADANFLYKELFEANENLKTMKGKLPDNAIGKERAAVYAAFKGVTGLGDPITKQNQQRQVKGLLRYVFGDSPKTGVLQSKLISTQVDNVGRAVIVPNADLDIDEIGLPEPKAFDAYERFVVARLVKQGVDGYQATKHVRERTHLAKQALQAEMKERPVLMSRAPVWHRFGVMAFHPRLIPGDVIHIPPFVTKPYGADFDGDAVQYHVPTSQAAIKEAYDRMLPSRNLISPADLKSPVYLPNQEYQGGLFHATSARSQRPLRIFKSRDDVLAAWRRGDIDMADEVSVSE
jgi:DNA-directed RNA polymerase beta' subunit